MPISEATAKINDVIYHNTPSDKFITFFWGMFSPSSSTFRFVNAGHNPPLWLPQNEDQPVKLEEGGIILGFMPSTESYEEKEIELKKGDVILFYTDGVTEAKNENKEEYGEARLINCLKQNRVKKSEELVDAIINDVKAFSHQRPQDDMTLLVIKVN